MERALQILNDLEREGIISRYAIGGAVGATFYTEPIATFDLDVFVILPLSKSGLITLAPLYDNLRARGYTVAGECVRIAGIPVQFLPAYNPLVEEALDSATDTSFASTRTRVLRPEHLLAISIQTGREKDRQRVRMLRAQASLDMEFVSSVLKRYHLEERWKAWTD